MGVGRDEEEAVLLVAGSCLEGGSASVEREVEGEGRDVIALAERLEDFLARERGSVS